MSFIAHVAIQVALVMLSVIPHEVAHGWVAWKLGDPTAKEAGRLTLNPLKHIDPVGSVLLPLLMSLAGGPIFAYAKPVPYNPMNFRPETRNRDEALVALAGPAANLIQALLGALVINLAWGPFYAAFGSAGIRVGTPGYLIYEVLQVVGSYVYLNLVLMCFNLIPLPPLDGSKVISVFIKSPQARRRYYMIQQYSMPILLVALYLLPYVFHVNPVGWILNNTAGSLFNLLMGA